MAECVGLRVYVGLQDCGLVFRVRPVCKTASLPI